MEFFLLILALSLNDYEILSPSVIVSIMWLFSTICASYNIETWGIALHTNTFIVITFGIFMFIFIGFVARKVPTLSVSNYRFNRISIGNRNFVNHSIHINWAIVIMLVLLGVITVLLQYRWLVSAAGGVGSWTDMMDDYRNETGSYNENAEAKPSILSNLEFLLRVSTYILTYVAIYNIIHGKADKKHLLIAPLPLCYIADKILNAGRGDILIYFGAVVLMFYVMTQQKVGWKRKVSRKFINVLFVCGFSILFLFSASRALVGRKDQTDPVYYITRYAGGSIELFDLFLQDKKMMNDKAIFGKETLAPLMNFLGKKMNIPQWVYIHHLEFRSHNGARLGNVYGAFRYYIHDFGYVGFVVLTILSSVFHNRLYKYVRSLKTVSSDGFDWVVFVYMFFAPALFMHSIADYTYPYLAAFNYNIKFVVFAVIVKLAVVNFKGNKLSIGRHKVKIMV